MFIEHLLHAKCYTHIISFNSYSNSEISFIILFFRGEKTGGSERLGDLPNIAQVVSKAAEIGH